ncbi:PR domain zinc finger protein 8 [Callorhinchus milii]|uniref:PR domain zinc finger protein 8 n=1 Tax=Callorhinchus milii TaxID=7868 RepID=A0A4W3GXW3_CALMI|nr:PR domain zinc finger protein 8 [Callorhinchus milii]|eukprot:gi/632972688/ref/XP_007902782.1/ PREDICTED: zinc finger protein 488 [Callorhinchus milii]
MELAPLSKGLWTVDHKSLHHHFTDILTSVHTTREIPENANFGPCVLQNSFCDTIAFIALKSADCRSVPYVFRVDATAMNNSTDGLSWLRLVQAATNAKEQNLEAYLKNGQLYYRSVRRIGKDEELFVWYDRELSHLLGFGDKAHGARSNAFRCLDCGQEFKYENPYLAHVRFLCGKRKDHLLWRDFQTLGFGSSSAVKDSYKSVENRDKERGINFHRMAHDLEHSRKRSQEEGRMAMERNWGKRKQEDWEESKVRKSVLLERTNHLECAQGGGVSREDPSRIPALALSVWKFNSDKYLFHKDSSPDDHKRSAFTEVRRPRERGKGDKTEGLSKAAGSELSGRVVLSSIGSAFSSVLPSGLRGEQKSAFCQPANRRGPADAPSTLLAQALQASAERAQDFPESVTVGRFLSPGNLLGSSKFIGSGDLGNTPIVHTSPFLYAAAATAEAWAKPDGAQLQSTSSLTLLPPSFTSFGIAAQNWCAKCNASFRMTSDLVFHMRSHHKKECPGDILTKRRREEKLTCPICNEFFRERHHLSRHMTSHN